MHYTTPDRATDQTTNNQSTINRTAKDNRVFVPFSEALLESAGAPLGELVPFQLEYRCVRLLDGTYEFDFVDPRQVDDLKNPGQMGHAA